MTNKWNLHIYEIKAIAENRVNWKWILSVLVTIIIGGIIGWVIKVCWDKRKQPKDKKFSSLFTESN
jgi:heme/copper-type cytochrome/quinol oxidase subunit 2